MSAYLAASNDNWAYVNGVVKFGDNFSNLARQAAKEAGLDETQSTYVSNMVARQQLPDGHAVALGMTKNGRIQIWVSNLDRSYLMGIVIEALKSRNFVSPQPNDHEGFMFNS